MFREANLDLKKVLQISKTDELAAQHLNLLIGITQISLSHLGINLQ